MTKINLFVENGMTIDQFLMESLVDAKIISPSKQKLIESLSILEESRATNKTVFYRNRPIDRDIFDAVYSNIQNYQTHMDVAQALGFTAGDFGEDETKRKQNLSKFIQRVVKSFNDTALPDQYMFPSFDKRQKFYIEQERKAVGWEPEDPTLDDVNAGSKTKKDRVTNALDRINSQEILQGEFYANITRIPKTRWGSWLRFWDKEKTSVQKDRGLFGRSWGKTFIMGYQIERNVLYEVWYNSIDSTFSVHDINGIDVSSRVRTMNEATRNLVRMISQQSDEDGRIFSGSNPESKLLARSILNSVSSNIDPRVKELQMIDDKQAKEAKQARMDAKKEREQTRQSLKSRISSMFAAAEQREFDTDIKIGSGISEDEPAAEQSKPETFRKKENQVTPTIQRKYEREMAARAKADAEAKANAEAAKKSQWKADFLSSVPEVGAKYKEQPTKKTTGAKSKVDTAVNKTLKKRGAAAVKKSTAKPVSAKDAALQIKKLRDEESNVYGTTINETFMMLENFSAADFDMDLDLAIKDETQSNRYDKEIQQIRNNAERSPYTQSALKNSVMGQIQTYDETRIGKSGATSFASRLFIGRKDPIVLPTDKPSLYKRIKMAIYGQRYRADFIIGFSLAEKVNIEVWYITEPNPEYKGGANEKTTIASYYVFDITSGRVLRKYLPYYRNTLPVVMAKIGVI